MTSRRTGNKPHIEAAIDALRSHSDRLGALASIAARIGIYRDTRRLAREAMQAIANLLPIKAAFLLLMEKDINTLVFHEAFNLPTEDVERYHNEQAWDNCIEGDVVRRREPVLIRDVSSDSRAVHYMEGCMSLGLIPLLTPESVVGVLSVTTSAPHKLDQADMEFLLTLGSQLGVYLENIRLLEELEERNNQLLRQNQDLEELLSIISHDLRSPLATIGGYASLLMKKGEELDPAERTLFAETIFRKTRETSRRFDDLLAIFKADVERKVETPAEVDVKAAVEEALEEADRDGCRDLFTIDVPDNLPRLMGYSTHLVHVFANLFSNAFKYRGNQKDPRITVEYEKVVTAAQTCHQFSVSDNGRGIPADYIPNIFRPFTRVPTMEDIPGSGMGLASVLRIIRSQRGVIDIESIEGKGTTVTFTLPWEEVEESPKSNDKNPKGKKSKR